MPDFREGGRRLFLLGVGGFVEGPLHVRLAGAQPYLADKDVGEDNFVLATHVQNLRRFVRRKRVERHPPLSARIGGGGLLLPRESDRDNFPRCRLAPHGQRKVALQHHVVTENTRHGQLGESGRDRQQVKKKC